MKDYIVYFELFGKKMKTTVSAENKQDVKEYIESKIIFHKIEEENPFQEGKDIMDFLMGFGKK